MSFLYNPNRLKVATSRTQGISSVEQMRWTNALCSHPGRDAEFPLQCLPPEGFLPRPVTRRFCHCPADAKSRRGICLEAEATCSNCISASPPSRVASLPDAQPAAAGSRARTARLIAPTSSKTATRTYSSSFGLKQPIVAGSEWVCDAARYETPRRDVCLGDSCEHSQTSLIGSQGRPPRFGERAGPALREREV